MDNINRNRKTIKNNNYEKNLYLELNAHGYGITYNGSMWRG